MMQPPLRCLSCHQVLGKGNFGIVHLVYDRANKQPFACKSISKRKLLNADDVEDVRREVQILLHLAGHKHVVQLYGAYEDKNYICELTPGRPGMGVDGDLHRFQQGGWLSALKWRICCLKQLKDANGH